MKLNIHIKKGSYGKREAIDRFKPFIYVNGARVTFTPLALQKYSLKENGSFMFAQDEEKPDDWYMALVRKAPHQFILRFGKEVPEGCMFNRFVKPKNEIIRICPPGAYSLGDKFMYEGYECYKLNLEN